MCRKNLFANIYNHYYEIVLKSKAQYSLKYKR